jgi:glycosyltransferase involved in cell wall biosynthesis
MRVLHLISSGGMYGAEVMLLNLASAQRRLGCEPIIGVIRNEHLPHIEVAEEARSRGLQVELFDCSGRFDHKPLGTIRKVLRKEDVSLVHGHGYKSDLYGYFAANALGLPFVATCHLWTGASRAIRFYEFLDSLILRRAHKVVGVSDAISNTLRKSGLSPEKISTIHNGTDFSLRGDTSPTLRRELGIGERTLVGSVGRLEEQKGFEYFLRAAREVLSEFPKTLFLVVGAGPLRSRLESLIHDLGLRTSVLLVGQRNDMPGVYASLDLFVLASIDEGMPMTILEALASRKPVIATAVGAVEKLVIPEQTGLLVQPRDVPALRDAMLRCLRNQSFAQTLGKNGQEHVQAFFSAHGMARKYVELYERVLAQQKTKAATSPQEA